MRRLLLCATASLTAHLALIGLPGLPLIGSAAAPSVQAIALKITNRAQLASHKAHRTTPVEAAPTRQASGAAPNAAESIADSPPVLASEVWGHIDFPITPGFMILSLEIDASGKVESSSVIYTELSRYATQMIERRFVEADYSPATRHGRPAAGTLQLKIESPA